jgi:hypothetical protein
VSEQENQILKERYGAGSSIGKGTKRWLAIAGVAALVAMAGYFTLANYSPITYKDIGFSIKDSKSLEVVFEITKPSSETAICSLEALNEQFLQVGYKEVEIPATETDTVRITVAMNTTELATTALVDECWLK